MSGTDANSKSPEGPYELPSGSLVRQRYDREAIDKINLLTTLEKELSKLPGIRSDLRRLDIVIGLLTDHFLGRTTTMSSLTGVSKLSYSTAYRAIEAMVADGAIIRRSKTKSGKSYSLHPSQKLLTDWHATMEGAFVRGGRQSKAIQPGSGSKKVRSEVSIGPPPALPHSIGLSQGLRLLMHADPTFMAMHGLKRQFELILGVNIKSKALSIDRLDSEILRNAGRKVSEFDVVACDLPWFGDLVAEGRLLPLEESEDANSDPFSDFYSDAVDTVKRNGRVYGVPILTTAEQLVYRTDIFDELGLSPPGSTAELVDVSAKIMRSGLVPYGIAWNGARGTALGHTFMTIMAAHGCPIVDLPRTPDGFGLPEDIKQRPAANFIHEAALQSLEFLRELVAYSPPNVLRMNWFDRARSYARGDVGMAYSHTLLANLFELDETSAARGNTGYVPHPVARDGRPICPLGGYALAIPANIEPARIKGAHMAIDALTSPEATKLYVANGSLASARHSVNADPEVRAVSPIIGTVDEMARNGILRIWPRPPVRGIKAIIAIAGEEIHDALSGAKSPEAALLSAQRRSEQL